MSDSLQIAIIVASFIVVALSIIFMTWQLHTSYWVPSQNVVPVVEKVVPYNATAPTPSHTMMVQQAPSPIVTTVTTVTPIQPHATEEIFFPHATEEIFFPRTVMKETTKVMGEMIFPLHVMEEKVFQRAIAEESIFPRGNMEETVKAPNKLMAETVHMPPSHMEETVRTPNKMMEETVRSSHMEAVGLPLSH